MKDVVDEAADALREAYPGERRADTWQRIAAARPSRKMRAPRWVFWPVAATLLLLGTAWATPSGALRTLVGWIGSRDQAQDVAPVASAPSGPGVATTPSAPSPLPSASTSSAQNEAAGGPTASVRPAPGPHVASAATAASVGPTSASHLPSALPSTSASATAPQRDDADALYQEAHDAHFRDRDYPRAAQLWDRYLRAGGPLAPEARYNRGVALLRAGRNEEARKVLQPFADGEYGSYRRREAESLLHTLP